MQVFFYKLLNPHGTSTLKIEALRLVSNVQLVKKVFAVKIMANTALPCSSLAVTHDALRYLGSAHQ